MGLVENHVAQLIQKGIRFDGRKFDEFRRISVEYSISVKSAEGSARLKIGETEVAAGIKFATGSPFPDTPDEGALVVNVELLPLSSPDFEPGPPGIRSIEYARAVVDRGLRESKAIDLKKLCIKKGEKIWMVMIDVYSLNDAGNLADAIGLAALAAIKDAKFPKYDEKNDLIDYTDRTKKGIELKHLPVSVTVIKIRDKFLVDPTLEEENAMEARLTVTSVEDGRICAMQKGGHATLGFEDIDKMIEIGIEKARELRKFLK